MSRRRHLVLALAAALVACDAGHATYVWVDVQARPAVRGATRLDVTVSDGVDRLTHSFGDGQTPLAWPSAFTVTPNQHRGSLTLAASAVDADGHEVAAASAQVEVVAGGRAAAVLLLAPADFQVNTTLAGDQIATDLRAGRQVAAGPDHRFAVAFENIGNLDRYDGMARLFDADGAPRQNATGLTSGDFVLNAGGGESVYYLALAAAPDGGFLATWVDQWAVTASGTGAAIARRFDASGAGSAEVTLATVGATTGAGAGAAAALLGGGFVAVFTVPRADGNFDVHARLLDASGQPRVNAITNDALDFPVGTPTTTMTRVMPAVAVAADGTFLVTWLDVDPGSYAGTIRAQRFTADGGADGTTVTVQVLGYSSYYIEAPNLAACGTGYALVYTDQASGAADLDIFVRLLAADATPVGPPIRANTSTDGDQYDAAIAVTADGSLFVLWTDDQSRPEDADPPSIRGRLLQSFGLPIGVDAGLNTTTGKGQYMPSAAAAGDGAVVVAFQDESDLGPDTDLGGIRARLVYPDSAPRDGLIGARCDGAGPACADGLVCVPRADVSFCHLGCQDFMLGQACVSGGTCQAAAATGAPATACAF